jgi:HD-like signal output (HDOD) protein
VEPPLNLNRAFTARLLGVATLHGDEPSRDERRVLRRLEETANAPGDEPLVPRLPAVLPKLMRLIRRDDLSFSELADLLRQDAALLGEVMRLANSPRYAGNHTLISLDAALAMLGQNGLQQVIGSAAMAPVFDLSHGRFGASAGALLWEQAEACAQASSDLSASAADAFEAHLAGLVANTGLIVALRLLDHQPMSAAPASEAFHDQLAVCSARVSARIARHWRLSDAVVHAVEALALAEAPPGASILSLSLRTADRASKAHVLDVADDGLDAAQPGSEAACRAELKRKLARPAANAR